MLTSSFESHDADGADELCLYFFRTLTWLDIAFPSIKVDIILYIRSEEAEASPRPEEVRRVLSIESISNDKTLSINEWKSRFFQSQFTYCLDLSLATLIPLKAVIHVLSSDMIYDLITQKQGRTEQSLPWLILPVGVTVGYLVQISSNQKRMSYTAVLCGCVSAVVYYMSYKIALQM